MTAAGIFFLAFALALSGGASAGDKCPSDIAAGPPAMWGKPMASKHLGDRYSQGRVYQPRGLTMLGRRVPYVVLIDDEYFQHAYFRLGSEIRTSGSSLSESVRGDFSRAYPDVTCSESFFSCEANGLPTTRHRGDLHSASLESESLSDDDWQGAGARLVAPEQQPDDFPVFLKCSYHMGD